jgi:YVTN family beta-propeller protein
VRWHARVLVLAMLGCSLVWAPTAAGGRPSLAGSTGTVWVTNQTLNTVTAYDARTGAVLRTVNVGAKPIGVVAPPRASTVYVSNESDDTITLIDQATGRTSTIAVGDGPHHMVHSPSGRFVYFGEFNTNTVGAIDARSGGYRSLVASASPTAKTHAVWVGGRGGRTLYAVNSEADTFTALDAATGRPRWFDVPVGDQPSEVLVTPSGRIAYISIRGEDKIGSLPPRRRQPAQGRRGRRRRPAGHPAAHARRQDPGGGAARHLPEPGRHRGPRRPDRHAQPAGDARVHRGGDDHRAPVAVAGRQIHLRRHRERRGRATAPRRRGDRQPQGPGGRDLGLPRRRQAPRRVLPATFRHP